MISRGDAGDNDGNGAASSFDGNGRGARTRPNQERGRGRRWRRRWRGGRRPTRDSNGGSLAEGKLAKRYQRARGITKTQGQTPRSRSLMERLISPRNGDNQVGWVAFAGECNLADGFECDLDRHGECAPPIFRLARLLRRVRARCDQRASKLPIPSWTRTHS